MELSSLIPPYAGSSTATIEPSETEDDSRALLDASKGAAQPAVFMGRHFLAVQSRLVDMGVDTSKHVSETP